MKYIKVFARLISLAIIIFSNIGVNTSYGQNHNNIPASLAQKFQSYRNAIPHEAIYVSTDREQYISGEVIWFSLWLFNHQPSQASRVSQNPPTSKIAYLEVLDPKDTPVARVRIPLINGYGFGQLVLPDTLNNGLYSLRAYTNLMKNFLPENCFYKEIPVYNAFKRNLFQNKIFDYNLHSITGKYIIIPYSPGDNFTISAPDTCSARSKVHVTLEIKDTLFPGINPAGISVSVTPVTTKNDSVGFFNYEIPGSVTGINPENIINEKNPGTPTPEYIDSAMANINSRLTDRGQIQSDNLSEFKYKIENDVHFIYGTLLTSENKPSPEGEYLLMSTPGKIPDFKYAKTDENGRFSFRIPIDEEVHDFIIQPDNVNSNYKISLESSFPGNYFPAVVRSGSKWNTAPSYISDWSLNYQVRRIYGFSSTGNIVRDTVLPKLHRVRFYGKPSSEILLRDWTNLNNMQEVFFEIVPGVSLKKIGSAYEMSMLTTPGSEIYDSPPVIMIDGVIIRDPSIIASLNPQYVEKIDVIKDQYMVGDYLFNGIVNVITNNGDFSGIPVPSHAVRMKYKIFDPAFKFESPDYSTVDDRTNHIPDYRTTLYWNPNASPGKDGLVSFEFWTGDITGDYDIKIQGLDSEGKLFSIQKPITVK